VSRGIDGRSCVCVPVSHIPDERQRWLQRQAARPWELIRTHLEERPWQNFTNDDAVICDEALSLARAGEAVLAPLSDAADSKVKEREQAAVFEACASERGGVWLELLMTLPCRGELSGISLKRYSRTPLLVACAAGNLDVCIGVSCVGEWCGRLCLCYSREEPTPSMSTNTATTRCIAPPRVPPTQSHRRSWTSLLRRRRNNTERMWFRSWRVGGRGACERGRRRTHWG